MDENKFRASTKRRLAERSGYLCSLCGKHTVGPSNESKESVALIGDAAHISSAEPGGRRYDVNMTTKSRRDINNGIWLCKDHHKLADSDDSKYTISFLKSIKTNHERKVELLNSGLSIDRGLIVSIEIENTASFKTKKIIDLSNSTLFFGGNGTGKTLICDIISSLGNQKKINKWKRNRNSGSYSFTINFYANSVSKFRVNYSSTKEISYAYNEKLTPVLLSPYHTFYLENDFFDVTREIDDISLKLATYFKLNPEEVVQLVNHVNKLGKHFINDIYFEGNVLKVLISTKGNAHSFFALSTGEKYRVILELALRLSQYYSIFSTTVLIIESSAIATVDNTGINTLFSAIRKNEFDFQFIFTSHRKPEIYETDGFLCYELVNSQDGVNANIIKYG